MRVFNLPNTIRGRLILWFSVGAVLSFSILMAFISFFTWDILRQQIDHHIHIVATQAKQIVEKYDGTERDSLLTNLVGFEGMTVVLIGSDGTVLLQTNSPDVALATQAELERLVTAPTCTDCEQYHFKIGSLRFMTANVKVSNIDAILAVGYSVKVLEETFRNLLVIIGFALLISLLLILLAIKNTIDKNLEPLETIAGKAQAVTDIRNPTVNFNIRRPTREISNLIEALNSMTSKLRYVFEREHEFFSSAAHTIKTPLAVARAKVESQTKISTREKKAILNELDHVSDTVGDLLLISRLETKQSSYNDTFSLSKSLNDLVEITVALSADKNIAVDHSIESNIFVRGNEALVKRALSNLVQNAVNYTPSGGSIIIKLFPNKQKNTASIVISDNGIGIGKKDQSHIFERFYRGSNTTSSSGAGLGLAITKATVEQMGGQISLSSKLHQGTSFTIKIPTA